MGHEVHDLHTHRIASDMPVNQILWSHNKNFLTNGPKTSINSYFVLRFILENQF